MNKLEKIDVRNLKLASIRYYSEENRGVEVEAPFGCYAFLVILDDNRYVNPFNPLEEYPVFKRVPYSNTTLSGEDFGTKMINVNGVLAEGLCYVLSDTNMANYFMDDVIDIKLLEDYMLRSRGYYRDRREVARERFMEHPIKMYKLIKEDEKMEAEVLEFFGERGVKLQKVR